MLSTIISIVFDASITFFCRTQKYIKFVLIRETLTEVPRNYFVKSGSPRKKKMDHQMQHPLIFSRCNFASFSNQKMRKSKPRWAIKNARAGGCRTDNDDAARAICISLERAILSFRKLRISPRRGADPAKLGGARESNWVNFDVFF